MDLEKNIAIFRPHSSVDEHDDGLDNHMVLRRTHMCSPLSHTRPFAAHRVLQTMIFVAGNSSVKHRNAGAFDLTNCIIRVVFMASLLLQDNDSCKYYCSQQCTTDDNLMLKYNNFIVILATMKIFLVCNVVFVFGAKVYYTILQRVTIGLRTTQEG